MSDSQTPKTVFITATSSGIGLATATLFHSLGWNVVATMRTPSSAPSSFYELERESRFLIARLDYTELESIENAVRLATERFGRLDVVVCGGGYGQQGLFEAISREKVKAQFDVNLFGRPRVTHIQLHRKLTFTLPDSKSGIMDTIRTVLPHLRANPTLSTIITISAGASFCGFPLASLYASSKFALEGFMESLSYELASQNIFVKSVVPCSVISETGFARRTMGEAVLREDVPDDAEGEEVSARKGQYNEFVERIGERYGQMLAADSKEKAIGAMDVVKKIYEAATDGSDNLRYWIGSGDHGFVKARFESKSDEEYMAFMRSFFD